MDTKVEAVNCVLSKYTDCDFTFDSLLYEDLGLSSLRMMQVLGELRNSYGLTVEYRNLSEVRTVRDLFEILEGEDD